MAAAQGNLFAGVVGASATPTFIAELQENVGGDPIAYWSTNLKIVGHETQPANVEVYTYTENDPNSALLYDRFPLQAKGGASIECMLRSVGDCFFIKTDQPVTIHLEGIYDLQPV